MIDLRNKERGKIVYEKHVQGDQHSRSVFQLHVFIICQALRLHGFQNQQDVYYDPTCSQSRPQDRQNQICPMVGHLSHPPLRAQALQLDFLRQRNLDERGRLIDKRRWTLMEEDATAERKAIQTEWDGMVTRWIQYESGSLYLPFCWDVNATRLISQIKECCCSTIPLF